MSRIKADKAQAQIDLLEFKLGHVKITAPIDGVVLSGDLERARGVPVQRGQVLFELAPLDRMILEVAVPDADAARVQPGQEGEFSLQARPEESENQDDAGRARMDQWDTDVYAVSQAVAIHDPRQDPARFRAKCHGPKEDL